MEMTLQGDLSRFQAPDLLTFLNMGRRTGVVVMARPDQETKLFIVEGDPVFATSTKEQLCLGNLLIRSGKISSEWLDRLTARGEGGERIGEVLVSKNILSEQELVSFLKIQVSDVIFDTFEWREGTFAFYHDVLPPATAVTLNMDLQNLLMEGVRRIDERGRLKEVLPDLNMVVEAIANSERLKQSVNMTREEWQVFFLVDGRRSVTEICQLAGNPDQLATLQLLHRLLVANFVSLASPRATPSPAVPEAVEIEGTVRVAQRSVQPSAQVSVEFSPARKLPKPSDDTKEIVRAQAIPYLESTHELTLSRLVVDQGTTQTPFPLIRDAYTLGRHRSNDIVISDPGVSAYHARIDRTPEGFVIVDFSSRNGTFVNGQRVEKALLNTDDEIKLGAARLVYQVDPVSARS